ncbi:MAG: class I SAM-dependent RNA methyltransferase [Sphaerochaetaceae bacterium]
MKRRIELTIEKMVAKGEALARHAGKVFFVSGALPNERLLVEITEEKRDFSRGEVVEIIEASPLRIKPRCPYYGLCGGCDLQFIDNGQQILYKEAIIKENLSRIGRVETDAVEFLPTATANAWNYRNRVRLQVNKEVGFLARRSATVVPIDNCLTLCDALNPYFTTKKSAILGKGLKSVAAFAGDREVSLGAKEVTVSVGSKRLHTDAKVFFQSNGQILPLLTQYVASEAEGEVVLDLYAGVGTFAAFVEGEGRRVIAVERDRRCLKLAQKNLKNTEFIPLSLEEWVKRGPLPSVDTIIVDPPRVGLDKEVLKTLASLGSSTIIYVSCDSVTLSRDVALFGSLGYSLKRVKPFDMYPQTSHIEAVAILKRG